MENIRLSIGTDWQNILLMQLAYLDLDIEKYEDFKLEGRVLTVDDIDEILINPNSSYISIDENIIRKLPTQLEIIQKLKDNGLGNLKIIDIASDEDINFKAIALEDMVGDRGVVYSGTNFEKVLNSLEDGTDLLSLMQESQEQIEAGKIFYKENGIGNNRTYLYGHLEGGNIASHVYLDNDNDIEAVHLVNAIPINQEFLDSNQKIRAFNKKDVYCFDIIDNGHISKLDQTHLYEDNIRYINGNKQINGNKFKSLLLDTAKFDKDGNFEYISEEEVHRRIEDEQEQEAKANQNEIITFSDLKNEFSKGIKSVISKIRSFIKKLFIDKEDNIDMPEGITKDESFKDRIKTIPIKDRDLVNHKEEIHENDVKDFSKSTDDEEGR